MRKTKKQKHFKKVCKNICKTFKYKSNTKNNKECISKLFPDKIIKNNNVNGIVNFIQYKDFLKINYNIVNLQNGKHGFHVHKCGDVTKGCSSGCEHFNPYNKTHGSLCCKNSHAGDLGNIISKNGKSTGSLKTNKINIIPGSKKSIIGRMIIVHKDEDDLGKGNNEESLKTGNAGKRLACGIIGIKNGY